MKLSTILSIFLWALVLTIVALLSSCSKKLSEPYKIYYYTTNAEMPALYLTINKHQVGKVPLLEKDPHGIDTAQMLCVTTWDNNTEIEGVDSRGYIIQTFDFKFKNSGDFKSSGGGYILYDTWKESNNTLLIKLNGQFR